MPRKPTKPDVPSKDADSSPRPKKGALLPHDISPEEFLGLVMRGELEPTERQFQAAKALITVRAAAIRSTSKRDAAIDAAARLSRDPSSPFLLPPPPPSKKS